MSNTYQEQVETVLQGLFPKKNRHAIPHILKIIVNVGVGKFRANQAHLEEVQKTLLLITGQKPIPIKAKHSIAGFKLRAGELVGYKVTLRGLRMWDFLQKLVRINLPRVRDFRGINPGIIDRHGNGVIAFKEQTVFPEVPSEEIKNIHGLAVQLVSSAKSPSDGRAVLEAIGLPLKDTPKIGSAD